MNISKETKEFFRIRLAFYNHILELKKIEIYDFSTATLYFDDIPSGGVLAINIPNILEFCDFMNALIE